MKHSKLVWQNIYYMLCYCVDELVYFNDAYIDYEELNGTHDLLAALLCNSFELLYKNGYIKEYNKEQIITGKPRGRVSIPKSIEKGSIGSAKLVCSVSNIGIDSELNRIIKASFSILIESNKLVDDKINKNLMAKLYRYREMLDNVSDIEISLRELYSITELPEWYRPIFTVCKLIWNDWIAFDSEGNHRLLELNDISRLCYIWQKYLLHFSQKYFNQLIVSNPTYIDGWKIDKNGNKQPRQRHLDLLINDKYNKKAVIADAKYYNSGDGDSVSNRDQVNTYCDIFYNNHMDYKITGLLLIASDRYTGHIGGKDGNNGIEINSYTININQDKDNMESDIIDIIESYLNKTKLEES